MDENYVPANDEERALIAEFERDLQECVRMRESAKKEKAEAKEQLEIEQEKRKSAHIEMAGLVERLGNIEKRAQEKKQRAMDVIRATEDQAERIEKTTSGQK